MRHGAMLALVVLAGCHKLACGDGTVDSGGACVPTSTLSCGDGTFEYQGTCVPYDPSDTTAPTTTASPAGGRFRTLPTVVLVPSEPSVVRFTTDGSDPTGTDGVHGQALVTTLQDGVPLKFFSTDAAGNAEAVQSMTYTVDTTGPAAVTGASATVASGLSLSWTNPSDSDLAGVLVTRFTGWLEGAPSDGTSYAAGDTFGDQQVLGTETGTSATDDPGPGVWRYALYPADDLHNYGTPVVVDADVPLPAQTAVISLDLDAFQSTVTTAPSVLGLQTQVTGSTDNPSVAVSITNDTGRTLFAPKLVVTNDPDGLLGSGDGTLDTHPYFRPRVAGIAPGATVSWPLGLSASSGTHTISIAIEADPVVVAGRWTPTSDLGYLFDTATQSEFAAYAVSTAFVAPQMESQGMGGALSPDGRFLYNGSRTTPVVQVHDLTTGQIVLETEVAHTAGKAATPDLVADMARQVFYVSLIDGDHASDRHGDHRYGAAQKHVDLLRYDPITLEETGRAELTAPALTDGFMWSPRRTAVSPDGTLAAVPLIENGATTNNSAIAIVDLRTMTQVDVDASTDGIQCVLPTGGLSPSEAVFSPDGSKLYLNDGNANGELGVIDTSTWAFSTAPMNGGSGQVITLSESPTGLLWIAGSWDDNHGLDTFDGSTVTHVGGSEGSYRALGWSRDGSVVYALSQNHKNLIEAFDASSKSSLWVSGPAPFAMLAHHLLVTP